MASAGVCLIFFKQILWYTHHLKTHLCSLLAAAEWNEPLGFGGYTVILGDIPNIASFYQEYLFFTDQAKCILGTKSVMDRIDQTK